MIMRFEIKRINGAHGGQWLTIMPWLHVTQLHVCVSVIEGSTVDDFLLISVHYFPGFVFGQIHVNDFLINRFAKVQGVNGFLSKLLYVVLTFFSPQQ